MADITNFKYMLMTQNLENTQKARNRSAIILLVRSNFNKLIGINPFSILSVHSNF